jgi:hypothetical protein
VVAQRQDVAHEDNHLNLYTIDAATGRAAKIETDAFSTPGRDLDAVWSPDSKWIAYSKALDSHLRAIFLYSLADGKPVQVTDGLADAISPAFDAGGKYLYFLASTDYGPRTGWVEMSAVDRPVRRRGISPRWTDHFFRPRGVRELGLPARVPKESASTSGFQDAAAFLGLLPQPELRPVGLGDVARDLGNADGGAGRRLDRRDAQRHLDDNVPRRHSDVHVFGRP